MSILESAFWGDVQDPYLLMKRMFSDFTLAIFSDCLFLGIFQSFYRFVSIIFDQLALLNVCFKRCYKSLFSPFQ